MTVHDEKSEVSTDRGRDADGPTEIPATGWKDVALRVKEQFKEDHVALCAAAIAFHAFITLIPLLVAAVSIYGLFANPSRVTSLVDRLGSSVPDELSALIEQQLTSIVGGSSSGLGIGAAVGILGALWSASGGVTKLMEALNIVYDEDVDDRPFWKKRGIAILLTLMIIAFIAIVATIATFAGVLSGTAGLVLLVAAAVVCVALFAVTLAIIYRYGPDRKSPEWSWVSAGSIFAIVAWIIASVLFTFYVSNFGSYNETYGSLGAIVVVLLWMMISALAMLLGAEINSQLELQTERDTTTGPDEPIGQRGAEKADAVAGGT